MNLYFISGLGADKRVFQKLTIPETFTIHYLEWVPVIPEETLAQYCNRLTDQVNLNEPFVLIGLSFGGVVAIELSRKIKPVKIILISSIARTEEAGMLNKVLGRLKLYRIIPVRFLLTPSRFLFRLFGAHTGEEKDLLTGILRDTDPGFFRWSLDRLFSWRNEWEPEHLLHIHGTSDKIIPYNEHMQAIPVKGGEHLMVYSKADEISALLQKYLPAG